MKKVGRRITSFVLSVALILGCIYVSEPMEAEATDINKFDEIAADFNSGTDIIEGEVLVSEDFSSVEVGTLPIGWQNHVGSWMWAAGSNTVGVKEKEAEKYLGVSDNNGTTAIVFPTTGTANYIVTANVYLDSPDGAVGLITNLSDPADGAGTSASNAVTLAYLSPGSGTITMKNRYSSVDKSKTEYALPEGLELGTTVKFTACSYKGYTYFYLDDVFIGKIEHLGNQAEKSLCGLYVCGGKNGFSVKDVTISKVARDASADIRSQVTVLENLVNENFAETTATELPEGWKLIQDTDNRAWLWNGGNPSATIVEGGLKFTSSRDGALLVPSLGTSDYVMTATIQCKSDANYMGLLSNVIDPATTSIGATKSYIQMKNKGTSIIQENRVSGVTKDTQTISTTEILDAVPGNNTELTLQIYSFRGYTYFYINDVFVQKIAQASPQLEKSLCGFYLCATTMLIKTVRVDALGRVGDISREVYATEPVLQEDFSGVSAGTIPENWEVLQDKWIWNPTNEKSDTVEVVVDANNKKSLKISDMDGGVGLMLPAFGTSDYVLTATLVPESNGGTVGLLTNSKEPLSKAVGATHSILSLKGNAGTVDLVEQYYKHENKLTYDKQSVKVSDYIGKLLGSGDSIELTVYSWQGYTYFYVNNYFVCFTANRNAELETSLSGLYVCGTSINVHSVSAYKLEAKGQTSAVQMVGAAVRYADADGIARGASSTGMRFVASVDKKSYLYNVSEAQFGMIISSATSLSVGDEITIESEGVVDFPMEYAVNEDETTFEYATTIVGLTDLDEYFAARAYMKIGNEYYYSNQIKRSPARLATRLAADESLATESVLEKLMTIFGNTQGYLKPEEVKTLDFTVLGDLHYKEGMYAATVEDLTTILGRANDNESSFVMHMGDFCNDYKGSVELTNAYLASNLPTYGVYGNHELESANNSMEYVTPLLTNQSANVVWGTADGKIGDGSIGYYYFEINGFRIVCTDSNYSWNEANQEWQHNTTNSYGSPTGNTKPNSLGSAQLAWLENVLTDAAESAIPCVVMSHATMAGVWEPSPDSDAVQAIFRRVNGIQRGTVLLALNGHNHQDHMKIMEDVVYIDINTVRNGFWNGSGEAHYTDDQTFNYVKYDADGNVVSSENTSLNTLSSGKTTWFFEEPLSANIRISTAGFIHVDGWETTWMYDVDPKLTGGQARTPWISDYKIDFLY